MVDNNVTSLQEIVIFELVKKTYQQTRLNRNISDKVVIAYRDRKFGEYAIKVNLEEIMNHTIERLCEKCALPNLPDFIRNRLFVCFKGIVGDICQFAFNLASSLKQYNPKRVQLCVDLIVITQSGKIDAAKTVLQILKKTDFLIEFNHDHLFHYLVKGDDIKNAANVVLESIKGSKTSTKATKIRAAIDKSTRIRTAIFKYSHYEDYTIILTNYFDDTGPDQHTVMTMAEIVLSNEHGGVQAVCNLMTLEQRHQFLKQHIDFLLNYRTLDADLLRYLCHNYPSEEWILLVKDNIDHYIDILLDSWQHRTYAVTFFKDSLAFIGEKEIKNILQTVFSQTDESQDDVDMGDDIYTIKEKVNIMKNIWLNTPENLKYAMKDVISKNTEYNFELLKYLIDYYPVSDQSDIINKIMMSINNNECSNINQCSGVLIMYAELCKKSNNQLVIDNNLLSALKAKVASAQSKKKFRF